MSRHHRHRHHHRHQRRHLDHRPQAPQVATSTIASILRIHPRFMRSVQLERDIADPSSSRGYILTETAKQAFERITASFQTGSTQRAWRIAGDYGSGKTDFALALARVAAARTNELPKDLHKFAPSQKLLPILATGDQEPLAHTLMRALGHPVRTKPGASPARITSEDILTRIASSVAKARRKGYTGAILIMDELGKNLEFAASHPDQDDIFLLQRLGEEAPRSGNTPLVVVGILHQAVAAYSGSLHSAGKKEWTKIAGRFEEIVYTHHLEQVATLLAATLRVDTARLPQALHDESKAAMRSALSLGLYGASAATALVDMAPQLFPLHPTLIPALVKVMRRFGQNERSLFGFVSSAEPKALQEHAQQPLDAAGHYRLYHLFDYLRNNLLPAIETGSSHTHWGVIDAVLSSARLSSPEQEQVLKTVALLTLLDTPELPATEEVLALAIANSRGLHKNAVVAAIKNLRDRGLLYERGVVNGFCLWPDTSVNLDDTIAKALEATRQEGADFARLCSHVRLEHIVPRQHYVKTGTLRFAQTQLIPASQLDELLQHQPTLDGKGPDLFIRIVLPEDDAQKRQATHTLQAQYRTFNDGLLLAIADPAPTALAAFADRLAWEWVKNNTPALAGDRYAREEVARQLETAERNLHTRLAHVTNLAAAGAGGMTWFNNREHQQLQSGKELLAFLSRECDHIYHSAPKILNELINRHSPSSAAVSARTRLVEAMATAPDKLFLGMDQTKRPAEMALYISILQVGNFHVNTESGPLFVLPNSPRQDTCRLMPVLNQITTTLQNAGIDALVPLPDIFEVLAKPPYGTRRGLIPFIVAIYLATHHQRVALYEDGTYLHHVGGEEFFRLMKEPQFFHLQYCALEGVRSGLFTQLLELMHYEPRDPKAPDLIDLIRPLVVFISREIPEYARRTDSPSARAVAVRRALLETREPVRLIFTALPKACDLDPVGDPPAIDAREFALRLANAIHDLRTAYPKLIDRLGLAICSAFDLGRGLAIDRPILCERASLLERTITEPSLRAFALRLADTKLDHRAWVESTANLLTRKSPERWVDADEAEFYHQLELMAARFRRVEGAHRLGAKYKLNGHACRIALTRTDGTEVDDLIDWDGLKEDSIHTIQAQISEIITQNGRRGLAAAIRALWTKLESAHLDQQK
jgi:hypothetical protein